MNEIDIFNRWFIDSLFLFMITFSYFLASYSSSGVSEADKYFHVNDNKETQNKSIVNISSTNYTDCEYCKKKKFVRSSHCRTCQECVLRRDHHCIWIGNCVGIGNNQYFINFCLWITVFIF
jgi:hypothetical protein